MTRLRLLPVLALTALTLAACSDDTSRSTTTAGRASETTTPSDTIASEVDETTTPPTTELVMGHIRGTAYTFNTPNPIAGATVSLVEHPEITAVTGADGAYELEVPAGESVTPVIQAAGHHETHLQTFTLDAQHEGLEIDGVNFQTPEDAIYDALKGLITAFTGKDPFVDDACVIVSTVSDKQVVGMTFDQFINFHPHGKAGASATITPAAAQAIYFNKDVLPDQAQTVTSEDGGVLWPNVPAGEYMLTASLTGASFAEVHVTCQPGWVVNASPVWGLHELA